MKKSVSFGFALALAEGDGWAKVVTGLPRKYEAAILVQNGKIVLKVRKKGLILIIR